MVRAAATTLCFATVFAELPLRYMIKHGYLTPPERLDITASGPNTISARLQAKAIGCSAKPT